MKVRSHVLSAVFLALVSANVIQAGLIPGLFNSLPSFVELASLPRIGALSHDFFSDMTSAATSAFGNFRNYFDDFRLGLGQRMDIDPSRFPMLNHFVRSRNLFPVLGNGGADGASAAAAASVASGSSVPQSIGAPIAQPLPLGGSLLGTSLLRRPARSYTRDYDGGASVAAANAAATEA